MCTLAMAVQLSSPPHSCGPPPVPLNHFDPFEPFKGLGGVSRNRELGKDDNNNVKCLNCKKFSNLGMVQNVKT